MPTPTTHNVDIAVRRAMEEVPTGTPGRWVRIESLAFRILSWEYDPGVIREDDLKASVLRNIMPTIGR